MKNIYMIGDTHFYHDNIRRHCNRPWNTVEDMNDALIQNWNSVVKQGDTVYHLGDWCMAPKQENGVDRMKVYRKLKAKLSGKHILIKGNHDEMSQEVYNYFTETHTFLERKINGYNFTFCHYPLLSWNRSFHNQKNDDIKRCSIMIHGHCHNRLVRDNPFRIDVGCDGWNYTPIHFDDIITDIEKYKNILWKNNIPLSR